MLALISAINDVREKIKNNRQYYEKNEEEVRRKLINPILQEIGWSDHDEKHVKTNFPIIYPTGGRRKLDYLLLKGPQKVLIIESKNLGQNITNPIIMDQTIRYCDVIEVDYGLITNGLNWCLINKNTIKKNDSGILWKLNIVNDDLDIILQKFQTISFKKINNIENGVKEVRNKIRLQQREQDKKQNEIERKNDTKERSWKEFLKNRKKVAGAIFNLFDSSLNNNNKSRDKFTKREILDFLEDKIQENISMEPKMKMSKALIKNEEGLPDKSKKSISKLKFNGKIYPVRSSRDALLKILDIMRKKHPKEFPKILELHGRKRRYFSIKKDDLVDPKQIPGSKIYCMMNRSAESIEGLIRTVLETFKEGSFELL